MLNSLPEYKIGKAIYFMYERKQLREGKSMKKSLNKIVKSLSQRDLNTLQSIYQYRCLSAEQIHQLHYQDEETASFQDTISRIKEMVSFDLLKEIQYKGTLKSYFLTPSGIEVVRYMFELPANIYDAQRKVVRRGYYRASELEIYPKNINHQIHLNQFVIEFQQQNQDINYKYFDEKYVSSYTNIRPDGMLSILDTDFFLEMDMATESKKQLFEKWENYRNFLNSREYSYREKRIIVLFIVDGTERIQQRIDLVKFTIYERLLDVLDSDFEIYVGTKDELLHILKKRLIPACMGSDPHAELIKKVLELKHGFHVTNGEQIKNIFHGTKYGFYIRKLNEAGKVVVENNRVQEFLVDDYIFEKATVVSKIAYMSKNNTFFKQQFQREISYLIIAKNEEQLFRDLRMIDLLGLPNIYFSTYQRLKENPFHEALFQIDMLGNLHHFVNNGLDERVFEENLSEGL